MTTIVITMQPKPSKFLLLQKKNKTKKQKKQTPNEWNYRTDQVPVFDFNSTKHEISFLKTHLIRPSFCQGTICNKRNMDAMDTTNNKNIIFKFLGAPDYVTILG